MAAVFEKTDKGRAEITDRSGGLHPRTRRLLIMIDGKRSVDQLRDMVAADDLTHTLAELEEAGYIEIVSAGKDSGSEQGGDVSPAPAITFRELGPAPDPADTEKARHFMINTLRTFCGQYTHVTLMSTINSAKNHDELRLLFSDWYRHIADTRQGGKRADELRDQLLKVI